MPIPPYFDQDVRLGIVELANLSETTESISIVITENDEIAHDETYEFESREGCILDCDWGTEPAHFIIESSWEDHVETVDLHEEDVDDCVRVISHLDADYNQHWALASECPERDGQDVLCLPIE